MSKYKYVPDSSTWCADVKGDYIVITNNDTLADQQAAFDRLRKETAIECYRCAGTGVDILDMDICCLCDMEGVLCAYCHMHDGCECGGGDE